METSFRLGCRVSAVKHHVQIALTKPAPIRVRMSLCLATTSYQFVDKMDYTYEKKRVNKCQRVLMGAVSPAVSGFDLQPPQWRLRIARLSGRFPYVGFTQHGWGLRGKGLGLSRPVPIRD
jgi:hypothetical protein